MAIAVWPRPTSSSTVGRSEPIACGPVPDPLAPPGGVAAAPGLNANDDVYPVGEALAHESGSLMVVGHLPFLGRLTGFLQTDDATSEPVRFHNAGIVHLVRADGRWSLDWSITPEFIK